MDIIYQPIGVARTPFTDLNDIPRQSALTGVGIRGSVEVFPEYQEGLNQLESFSRLVLLCHFHRAKPFQLIVTPPGSDRSRGLFASRSPNRPNPIGMSVVRLISVKDNILEISDLDMLDGTPILDIKPFFPALEPGTTGS